MNIMERATFHGGQLDGTELDVNGTPPRLRLPVPQDPALPSLHPDPTALSSLETLTYDLALDHTGHPSRDDYGRLCYRLRTRPIGDTP